MPPRRRIDPQEGLAALAAWAAGPDAASPADVRTAVRFTLEELAACQVAVRDRLDDLLDLPRRRVVVMLIPVLGERFSSLVTPLASGADQLSGKLNAGSLGGALLRGALLGLIWSPCSGPLLAAALTLVATEGGALRGTLILGAFGAGAATPLVLAAYASRAGFSRARNWVLGHAKTMKNAFGALLVLLGIAILMGWDKRLEALILPLLPDAWVNVTVAI